jgi:hypothetical protein
MNAVLNAPKDLPETWRDPDPYDEAQKKNAQERRQNEEPVLVLDFVSYKNPVQGTLTIDECQKLIWNRVVDFHISKARVEAMVEKARGSHSSKEILAGDSDHSDSDARFKLAVGIFFHDEKHATVLLALVSSELYEDEGEEIDEGDDLKKKRTRFYQIVNSMSCLWYVIFVPHFVFDLFALARLIRSYL